MFLLKSFNKYQTRKHAEEMIRGCIVRPFQTARAAARSVTLTVVSRTCVSPGVRQVAGHITPVPGGVGPMTVAMLMKNTLRAYKKEVTEF